MTHFEKAMIELETSMKEAQDIFDKILFLEDIKTCFDLPEGLHPQEQDLLKSYDIPYIKKNGCDFPTIEQMDEDLLDEYFETMRELHDDSFQDYESDFILPDKESRRKTRKQNRKHKTYDVCGHSYKRYGKDKKVGKHYREERLYNNGFGEKQKAVLVQEYDNDTDIPALADDNKCEYRVINGYCYPSDYITDVEHELIIQAARMSEYGHTDTGKICGIIFFAEISNNGLGFLTVTVMTEAEILYQGEDFERAKEIFNVLTKNN